MQTAIISFVGGLVGAAAALLGAWWSGHMTYKAAELRYDALVEGGYKREWVADLRAAVADFLGQTHLFVNGYAFSEAVGRERVNLIRDLAIAKTKVQVLLDSEVDQQCELQDLCRDLARRSSSSSIMKSEEAEEAVEIINEIANKTEDISREELSHLGISDTDA